MANYEKLYGALSTLPIFLIWLYLIWVIVLIGSEIAFCLQHPEQSHRRHSSFLKPGVQQFYAHLILLRAAQCVNKGKTLTMHDLIEETDIPDNIMQEWLDRLCALGLLSLTKDQNGQAAWLPAFDASSMTLNEIHHRLNNDPMKVPHHWQETPLGRQLLGLYYRMEREQGKILSTISVREILEKENEEISVRDELLKDYDK